MQTEKKTPRGTQGPDFCDTVQVHHVSVQWGVGQVWGRNKWRQVLCHVRRGRRLRTVDRPRQNTNNVACNFRLVGSREV